MRAVPKLATLALALALALGFSGGQDRAPAVTTAERPRATGAITLGPLTHRCLTPEERARGGYLWTRDGVALAAVTLGQGTTGVLLGHERAHNLCNWMPFARELAARGYRVLAIDFRGFGASHVRRPGHPDDARPPRTFRRRLERDVEAGIAELRRLGAKRIILAGASMGATAMLSAAAQNQDQVTCVVSVSGPTVLDGMDLRRLVPRLHIPVLFLASQREGPFTEAALAMYRAAPSRHKRLVLARGYGHGTALLREHPEAPQLRATVHAFIDACAAGAL